MKKYIIIALMLLSIPSFALSAPSLSARLQGKILLAVEDKGKTYYVHTDGNRYRITQATAQTVFEKLALGITNKDLEQIPLKDVGIDVDSYIAPQVYSTPTPTPTTQCDYNYYNVEILKLKGKIAELEETIKRKNNEEEKEITAENTANNRQMIEKEYDLKINNLQYEILQLQDLQKKENALITHFRTTSNVFFGFYDNDFYREVLTKLSNTLSFSKKDNTSEFSKIPAFFKDEIKDREVKIMFLRNERERKLLEL